jgi:hypothetical protein
MVVLFDTLVHKVIVWVRLAGAPRTQSVALWAQANDT